jgi:hypothetical protein
MQDADQTVEVPREEVAPRFLRFVTALVLGGGIALAPALLGGCGTDTRQPDAHSIDDGSPIDAMRSIDADNTTVDGPLRPPNLPRLA